MSSAKKYSHGAVGLASEGGSVATPYVSACSSSWSLESLATRPSLWEVNDRNNRLDDEDSLSGEPANLSRVYSSPCFTSADGVGRSNAKESAIRYIDCVGLAKLLHNEEASWDVLLLDVRVGSLYVKSHISSAINVCLPSTLLRRATFTTTRLTQCIRDHGQRFRFSRWRSARAIVAYDGGDDGIGYGTGRGQWIRRRGIDTAEVSNCACWQVLRKFRSENFNGSTFILREGMAEFARTNANLMWYEGQGQNNDEDLCSWISRRKCERGNLKYREEGEPIDTLDHDPQHSKLGCRVMGGCPLPGKEEWDEVKCLMRCIDERIEVDVESNQLPKINLENESGIDDEMGEDCPEWLQRALNGRKGQKYMARLFNTIEKCEQARVMEALRRRRIKEHGALTLTKRYREARFNGSHVMESRCEDSMDIKNEMEQTGSASTPVDEDVQLLRCMIYHDINDEPEFQIAGMEDASKNRYFNRWPYEHSCVRLRGKSVKDDGNNCHKGDYFNGSYVGLPELSNRRYIATQAPVKSSMEDFWRAVTENNVGIIVMLTRLKEGNVKRADNYWRNGTYGNAYSIRIKGCMKVELNIECIRQLATTKNLPWTYQTTGENLCINLDADADADDEAYEADDETVSIRLIELTVTSGSAKTCRDIVQIHYTGWPDFGASVRWDRLLSLIGLCRVIEWKRNGHTEDEFRYSVAPVIMMENLSNLSMLATTHAHEGDLHAKRQHIIIQCSAGCGRTGTFCVVDTVIDLMVGHHNDDKLNINGHRDKLKLCSKLVTELKKGNLDLIGLTLSYIRQQRFNMVENFEQFVKCYEVIEQWRRLRRRSGCQGNGSV